MGHPPVEVCVSAKRDKRRKEDNPILSYIRSGGPAAMALGFAGMLVEEYFWFCVGLCYLGLILSLIDCARNANLGRWRYFLSAVFIFVIVAMTCGVVIGNVKPTIRAAWLAGNYPPGTDVHGILWRNGLSELMVTIANNTEDDIKDVDIELRTDGATVDGKSASPLCSLLPGSSIEFIATDQQGSQQRFPPPGSPSNRAYRLLCSNIPARMLVTLEVAVTDQSQNQTLHRG